MKVPVDDEFVEQAKSVSIKKKTQDIGKTPRYIHGELDLLQNQLAWVLAFKKQTERIEEIVNQISVYSIW
jgi:hypothetical protein